MASIAQFRKKFKDDYFAKIKFIIIVPKVVAKRFWHLFRKKSSFLAAPNLTFFIFPKEAVQQVKAKKCIRQRVWP